MKTAMSATLVAMLAGAVALAAPAQGAPVTALTSSCHDGDFTGKLTLRYTTSGGFHHAIGAVTAAGPYIGDSATKLLRITYHNGVTIETLYSRSTPLTEGEHVQTLPPGLDVPVNSRGTASETFVSGTASCVATVLLR
jgi:hypothetical protein